MVTFTLSEHEKNDNALYLDKYQFKSRKLEVADHEADAVAKILCNFYGCTRGKLAEPKKSAAKASTVSKAATKG